MKTRRSLVVLLLLASITVRCSFRETGRDLQIMFDIDGPLQDEMTDLQLYLYDDPVASLCDEEAMLTPEPWSPTEAAPFEVVDMTYGDTIERDLNPGRWGFVFRGGDAGEYPVGTHEMGRGCAIAELESGINPPVLIEVHPVFYPGVCGDGELDPEETCDDGNTAGGDECSADCRSTPVKRINTYTTAGQFDPAIAAGSFGYIVSFTNDSDLQEGSKYVRAQKTDHFGNPLVMLVDSQLKLNSLASNQSQEKPDVAVSGTDFTAVWLDFESSMTDGPGDVRMRTIDSTVGGGEYETVLNAQTAGVQLSPVIAGNGTSTTLVAAWTSSSSPPQDVMCRLIVDGAAQDAETPCSSETAGDQTQPAAAMAPDGSFAVAWRGPDASGSGVWLRLFAPDGSAAGPDVAVNTTTTGDQSHPALAYDTTGRLLVVFRDAGSGAPVVRGRLFTAAGTAEGGDFTVSDEPTADVPEAARPDVAGDAGRTSTGVFIVVWYSPGQGVRGRLVSGQDSFAIHRLGGAAPGEPFTDTGEFSVASDFPEMRDPQVAVSGSGRSLVVWVDDVEGPPSEQDVRGRVVPTS